MNVDVVSDWSGAKFGLPMVIAFAPPESEMQEDGSDYEVGYGKPPVATRFPKGASGNPSGKRKRREDEADWTFADYMDDELRKLETVTKDGQVIKVNRQRILAQAALKRAAKGDNHAARFVTETAAKSKRRRVEHKHTEDDEAARMKNREAIIAFLTSYPPKSDGES